MLNHKNADRQSLLSVLATARKMLSKNYSVDEISEIAGLPMETLKILK